MARRKSTAVIAPNLGLYLDRTNLNVPDKGLRAGQNFRIKNGELNSLNLGWTKFSEDWTLNGPVTFIDNFFPRNIPERLIFGTLTDIYLYDDTSDTVSFLTPRYATGTVSNGSGATTVDGSGTDWSDIKAGDQIAFGNNAETDPGATWFTIDSVTSATELELTEDAPTISGSDYTIRRLFTGNLQATWDFDTFINDGDSGDDLWLATNGVDDIISWNGSADQVTLHPEMGFQAKSLTVAYNMVLYSSVSGPGGNYPTSMINSDVGYPLRAGDTGTGLSEQFIVHSGTDPILNCIPLGDFVVFYSERNLTLAQFVGDPLVFIFRPIIQGIGPISADIIADFGDFHEFIGADTGYTFDGVALTEIGSHVWREVIRSSDPGRKRLSYAHFDEENGELIYSIPLNTDADVGETSGQSEWAYVAHYLEDTGDAPTPYSRRRFPFTTTGYYQQQNALTWATADGQWQDYNYAWNDQFFQASFPLNLAGDKDGVIYVLNTSQQGDGVPLPSYVRFGRFPAGDGRARNILKRVYPFARQHEGNLEITVMLADHASGPYTAQQVYLFNQSLPPGQHFVSPFRRSRYMALQFGRSDGGPWALEGHDIDVSIGGRR